MQSKYEGNKEQIQKKPKSIDKRLANLFMQYGNGEGNVNIHVKKLKTKTTCDNPPYL